MLWIEKRVMLVVGIVFTTVILCFGEVSYLEPLNGEVLENGNQIQWVIESPEEVNFFIVQRSKDGIHFSPLAMIAKDAASTEYTFFDEKSNNESWFYRIVDVDYQGVGQFSGALYLEYTYGSLDVESVKPPTNITINDHIVGEMNYWLSELEFPTISKLGIVSSYTIAEKKITIKK